MLRILVAAALAIGVIATAPVDASAQQSRTISQKTVGPWTLIGFINPQNVPYCVATRQIGEDNILFARFQQGYGLAIQSSNFWLARGAAVRIRIATGAAGDNTVDGEAISTDLVIVRLTTDGAVMRQMAGLPRIAVTAEGRTFTIPLDGFSEALTELDACLAQRGQMGAPSASPSAPEAPQPPATPAGAPAAPPSRLPIPDKHDKPTFRMLMVATAAESASR